MARGFIDWFDIIIDVTQIGSWLLPIVTKKKSDKKTSGLEAASSAVDIAQKTGTDMKAVIESWGIDIGSRDVAILSSELAMLKEQNDVITDEIFNDFNLYMKSMPLGKKRRFRTWYMNIQDSTMRFVQLKTLLTRKSNAARDAMLEGPGVFDPNIKDDIASAIKQPIHEMAEYFRQQKANDATKRRTRNKVKKETAWDKFKSVFSFKIT